MALTLVWTKRAIQGYDKIVRYLEENWTDKEVRSFIHETGEFFALLSAKQVRNKRATDPFDQLIFERSLRIRHLLLDKDMNLMVMVLSSGIIVKSKLSDFPKLQRASLKHLNNWQLIGGGVAIEWPDLNEDLSLKGFVKKAYMNRALRTLKGNQENIFA